MPCSFGGSGSCVELGACGTPAHVFNNFALGPRIDQWSWDHKKFSLEYYNNWEDLCTSDLEDSVIFASITHSISDFSTFNFKGPKKTKETFLPGIHRFPEDRTNPPNSHAKNVGYENLVTLNFETYPYQGLMYTNGAPCFDWKMPCFRGLTFNGKGHLFGLWV